MNLGLPDSADSEVGRGGYSFSGQTTGVLTNERRPPRVDALTRNRRTPQ